jgi:GR25 family glycosyltransferase involved in LPS biosynthesis
MNKIYIIFILLLFAIAIIYFQTSHYELFINDDINDDINFYVITLKTPDRIQNINLQNKKLNANIIITDAVNGINLNQDELLKIGELSKLFYNNNDIKRNKEIGCYKSHYNIYNLINNNYNKKKYSIILEDDFNIIPENVTKQIQNLVKNLDDYSNLNQNPNFDFDIIFLGNTFANHSNDVLKDNIHYIDKNKFTIGTFAYLVNNKNISKIIEATKIIDSPIDNKMDTLIKNNQINAYVVFPNLINYIVECKSNITN